MQPHHKIHVCGTMVAGYFLTCWDLSRVNRRVPLIVHPPRCFTQPLLCLLLLPGFPPPSPLHPPSP